MMEGVLAFLSFCAYPLSVQILIDEKKQSLGDELPVNVFFIQGIKCVSTLSCRRNNEFCWEVS